MPKTPAKAAPGNDLMKAVFSSALAAFFMSNALQATSPKLVHAFLWLMSLGLVLAAYLFVARAKVESAWQAATIIGSGVLGLTILQVFSRH